MQITPMQPFGVKITNFDVENPEHTSKFPSILYANGIIFLPKDAPAPGAPALNTVESMSNLGALFGKPLMRHDVDTFVEPNKPVSILQSGGDTGVVPDAYHFHSDVSWWADPCAVGMLTNVVRPPSGGGNTLFQNANLMYQRLSDESREFLLNNNFEHSIYFSYAMGGRPEIADKYPDLRHVHPGVIRHPKFGYPIAYISRSSTQSVVGMTPEESCPILDKIIDEMYSTEHTYSHNWTEGDIIIWDNFGVQHMVDNNYTERRVMHKVTVMGDHPPPTKYEPEENSVSENVVGVQGAASIVA